MFDDARGAEHQTRADHHPLMSNDTDTDTNETDEQADDQTIGVPASTLGATDPLTPEDN